MTPLRALALTLLLAPSASYAQHSTPGQVVTGRVTLKDTNGPARFAQVLLKNTVQSDADNPFADLIKDSEAANKEKAGKGQLSPEEQAAQKKQLAASMKVLSSLADLMQAATTAADGTYTFSGIQPGTYYVHATSKGYIDPLGQFSDDDLTSADPAVRKRIAAVATVITVSATAGAHADLQLARGASISGRVLYDDGTPATGWVVRTVHDAPPGDANPFASMGMDASDMDIAHAKEGAITDDTGYYRLSGLQAGDYVVQARLTMAGIGHAQAGQREPGLFSMMGLKLTVYSGDTVRRNSAKPIVLHEGESRANYDLTLPLNKMHSLGGTVRAKSDGHPVNSGMVEATAQGPDGHDDPTMHLVTQVQSDGSFHFDYIPGATTYTLKVARAADEVSTGTGKGLGLKSDTKTTHTYGTATMPVQVLDNDVTDVKVDVPDAAKE